MDMFAHYSSDEFFKNAVGDLAAYTQHAHRQGITEDDVELLMRRCDWCFCCVLVMQLEMVFNFFSALYCRQGFVDGQHSMYSLVEKYLPLECRKEIIPCASSGNVVEPKY